MGRCNPSDHSCSARCLTCEAEVRFEDYRPPSHSSKTVLSTVHVSGPEWTRTSPVSVRVHFSPPDGNRTTFTCLIKQTATGNLQAQERSVNSRTGFLICRMWLMTECVSFEEK